MQSPGHWNTVKEWAQAMQGASTPREIAFGLLSPEGLEAWAQRFWQPQNPVRAVWVLCCPFALPQLTGEMTEE